MVLLDWLMAGTVLCGSRCRLPLNTLGLAVRSAIRGRILYALCLFTLCAPAMGQAPDKEVVLAGRWKLSAMAQSAAPGEQRLLLRTFELRGHGWQVRALRTIDGAYNPRLEIRPEFDYRGRPIALLRYQFGAAVEVLEVYGIQGGGLRRIQSLESGAFEWLPGHLTGKPLLVEISGNAGQPRVGYVWQGDHFEPVSP